MKKVNILIATLCFLVVSTLFSCQKKEPHSEQNPVSEKKLQSQQELEMQSAKEMHSDSVELAICKVIDSTLSTEVDAMLPWVYDKNYAITLIRFEDYDYLARLQKYWELNNTLNKADSINERKLLKLFNDSPDAFPKDLWNIRQLWQLLHYEQQDGDDHDTAYNLDKIAKKNNLSNFLKRYKKLYHYWDVENFNGNVTQWKNLNKKGVKMYQELKRDAILVDTLLDTSAFRNSHWQRDNLR